MHFLQVQSVLIIKTGYWEEFKRASELDMDVYVFTCFVNYDESEENKVGAFRIMDLPEFDLFDGVICMKTLYNMSQR